MSRSKSILLQVAFKEAASNVGFTEGVDIEATMEATRNYYSLLLTLHDEFGIEITDDFGGGRKTNRRTSAPLPDGVTTFELDGQTWKDYRVAKDNGVVKAAHPDFKSGQDSVWLIDRDGNPNTDADNLVKAGDLTAAMA